ncbi:MAG: DUF4091 domain-containing protein [Clostridia bacterium]|nr:DUF4091 domain-containing protein [Clostridia bacterium]
MLTCKIVSSMEKCFLDGDIVALHALSRVSILKNERLSIQLAYTETEKTAASLRLLTLRTSGLPEGALRVRRVESVPVAMPVYQGVHDDNYLRTTPGLYPDLLMPLPYQESVMVSGGQLHALWLDIDPRGMLTAGDHTLTLSLVEGEQVLCERSLRIHIVDAELPENEMYVTQWFHCDSLAHYYRVETFSEQHWAIVEQFARTAAENGINTLLTPILTPPLDTRIGGERLTTQLIGVTRNGDDYAFDFSLLDRWVDMCDRVGIRYLEISHLFTQWGAAYAPKVMATVDGQYRRIFGWDTPATGEAYATFLRALISAMLAHLRARGDDRRCVFHISDEPTGAEHLAQYKAVKAIVSDLLEGYLTVDALSNFDFYEQGIVEHPVAANDHIAPFLKAGVKGLWTYYCCGQGSGNVSNRFIAMPGARTRSIGMPMFKYDIAGFLQWGYNFYSNRLTTDLVDPYHDTCGDYGFPGGDSFSVYPAPDGTAYESMRLLQFRDALTDRRAMTLAAALCGKETVIAEMERVVGEIHFDTSLRAAEDVHAVREAVNALIERHLG